MNILRFHHVAIICSNYEKSKHFYLNILGGSIVKETFRKERNSYKLDIRIGQDEQIELFSFLSPPKRLTQPEACGLRHLALAVADIESAINDLLSHSITCEPIRIDEITGQRFTFFRDPDDLPIELYETIIQ